MKKIILILSTLTLLLLFFYNSTITSEKNLKAKVSIDHSKNPVSTQEFIIPPPETENTATKSIIKSHKPLTNLQCVRKIRRCFTKNNPCKKALRLISQGREEKACYYFKNHLNGLKINLQNKPTLIDSNFKQITSLAKLVDESQFLLLMNARENLITCEERYSQCALELKNCQREMQDLVDYNIWDCRF